MRLSTLIAQALFGAFALAPLVVVHAQGIAYPSFRYIAYETLNADKVALATALGYDADSWNTPGINPTESIAYANMGFGQETISDLGFSEDQWDCFVNHYLDPYDFWDELPNQVIKEHLMGIGFTQAIWDDSISDPASFDKYWEELTEEEQASATELCFLQETWDQEALIDWKASLFLAVANPANSRGIAYPSVRYVQYQTLNADKVALATALGYDEDSWNQPGTNPTETIAYANMGFGQETISEMGYTEDQWDCYVNHYLDSFDYWDELPNQVIKAHLMGLGFTQEIWDAITDEDPSSFDKNWNELSVEEQSSATELCYFQETWDNEGLEAWTTLPPMEARITDVEYPSIRYVQWAYLDPAALVLAEYLGYTQETWNVPGTALIEDIAFVDQGVGKETILELGFTEANWDCYINHYEYFDWEGLGAQGVQPYYTTLGWTDATWPTRYTDSVPVPVAFDTAWEDLSTEEKAAAEQLCYFLETWEGIDLMVWTTIAPEFLPTKAPSPASEVQDPADSIMEVPSGPTISQVQGQRSSGAPEGYGFLVCTVSIFLSLFLQ
jgi:hypothetical protein